MNFQSPSDVLESLVFIFPNFKHEWEDENQYLQDDGSFSLHAVYMVLLPFLSRSYKDFNREQLEQLAGVINSAVASGEDSENAVSTCFLEHLGQVGLVKWLSPLLSKEARLRLHA